MPDCLALAFGAALALETLVAAFALHFGTGVGFLAASLFIPLLCAFLEAMVWCACASNSSKVGPLVSPFWSPVAVSLGKGKDALAAGSLGGVATGLLAKTSCWLVIACVAKAACGCAWF